MLSSTLTRSFNTRTAVHTYYLAVLLAIKTIAARSAAAWQAPTPPAWAIGAPASPAATAMGALLVVHIITSALSLLFMWALHHAITELHNEVKVLTWQVVSLNSAADADEQPRTDPSEWGGEAREAARECPPPACVAHCIRGR